MNIELCNSEIPLSIKAHIRKEFRDKRVSNSVNIERTFETIKIMYMDKKGILIPIVLPYRILYKNG